MNDSTDGSTNEQLEVQPNPLDQARLTPEGPSTIHKIFYGKDGLRAGWGILIFIAMIFALLRGVSGIIRHYHLLPKMGPMDQELPPMLGIIMEALPFLLTVLVTWIMSKVEKRPAGVYGLGGQRAVPNFFAGFGWGIVCLSLLIVTLWRTGLLVFDTRLLFGSDVIRYGLIWLVGFFTVGLLEEYLTRGYILFTLTRGLAGIYEWIFKTRHSKALGFWTAAIGLSVLFGLGHGQNSGESPIGLLSAGLAGLVFCLSLWRTGSLWWAIGFHTTWDWAQSFLYGVADSGLMVQHHLFATHPVGTALMSGGKTGPEGSIVVLPTLLLVCLIIIFTLPRGEYGIAALSSERDKLETA